jgi:hypothetical protein
MLMRDEFGTLIITNSPEAMRFSGFLPESLKDNILSIL